MPAAARNASIHIGVDVGGTFTDLVIAIPARNLMILRKLPSTPAAPDRAIVNGIAEAFAEHGLATSAVVKLAHGTTVGTNALIERRIGAVGLVTSDGFRDLLEIGRQTRPRVYDMHSDHPSPLVPRHLRIEVGERMLADGRIHRPLDEEGVRAAGRTLVAEGVDCIVVCFLHSYGHPAHEDRAAELLREVVPDRVEVLTSSSVFPEFREYERFSTAVLNGALLTVMQTYLDRLTRDVAAAGIPVEPKISQSAGGLMSVRMARRLPIRACLSGPAAGALGAAQRAETTGYRNIITLDMGGTSADVSLLIDRTIQEVRERTLAGFPLRLPSIDVNAVGAGGGSIAWIDRDELLKVGPESAGADPGPACYGLGGRHATVTDANVVLGRLSGTALLDGGMPIDKALAEAAVDQLAGTLKLTREETALGIVRMVCATMVKAIRSISVERGHNPAKFALFPFGGAGPLHAPEVARELDMKTIVIPPHPGVLCAEGALGSNLVADFVRTILVDLKEDSVEFLNRERDQLVAVAEAWFDSERIARRDRRVRWSIELRYRGQNYELLLPLRRSRFTGPLIDQIATQFHRAHKQAYGFATHTAAIQLVNLAVKAIGMAARPDLPRLGERQPASPHSLRPCLFTLHGRVDTPVFRRIELAPRQMVVGPAIVEQLDTTVIVPPDHSCLVDDWGSLIITLPEG